MATWKKVIVSGSNAEVNKINIGGVNQQISGSAADTRLSGSFSGSFSGNGSGLTGVVATAGSALSQSTGITSFSYDGSSTATVSVSGASTLNANTVTKWTGNAFANSSLTDDGNIVSSSASIQSTGANSKLTGSFSGSFTGDGSGLTGLATTLGVTGSNGTSGSVNLLTQGLTITGTSNEIETSISGQTVTIGLPNDVTISQNLSVQGNLTVAGTASFQNQSTLEIADRFVVVASGSTSLTDGGIIVAAGGTGHDISGSAFYLESSSTGTSGRFAIASNVPASASTVVADEYMVSAKQASGAPSTAPTWGSSTAGFGNLYVDGGTGDIYIYS
jgi:hypothetical protein